MVFDLCKKEASVVAGGKDFICHTMSAVKKGMDIGGMVYFVAL